MTQNISDILPVAFDANLTSKPQDLLPVNDTYTAYSYDKVTATNGQPSLWLHGTDLTFVSNVNRDGVYDFNESYVELDARVHVTFTNDAGGANTPVEIPLSAFSTCAIEKYFFSGLCQRIDVTMGNTPILQLDAPADMWPLVHSLYTTVSWWNDKIVGEADSINLARVTTLASALPDVKANLRSQREWNVTRDAEWPFNICQSADSYADPNSRLGATGLPIAVQEDTANFQYYRPWLENNGHQYRSMMILNSFNNGAPTAGVTNTNYKDSRLNMTCRLKLPLADIEKKLSANVPYNFNFRRSNSDNWLFMGNALVDATLSSGTAYTNGGTATYKLVINDMALYLKRLTLTEVAKAELLRQPEQIYNQHYYTVERHDLTSLSLIKNLAYTRTPNVVFGALFLKEDIRNQTPFGASYSRYRSAYNTAPRDNIGISELYLITNNGQIPRISYRPSQDELSVNVAQSGRAYREFVKACYNQELCPITFRTWLHSMNWYAFILNESGESPYAENTRTERSGLQLNVSFVLPPGVATSELEKYTFVTVSQQTGTISLQNNQNVLFIR